MMPFLDAVSTHLPPELSQSLQLLQTTTSDASSTLDTLIRFVVGGDAPQPETQTTWAESQSKACAVISELVRQNSRAGGKRPREGDTDEKNGSEAKRQRTEVGIDNGTPVFTLSAISANSPVRRKVDITIYSSSVVLTNASTGVVESSIPLGVLKRAFLLPTRGKMKPHWTVVVLSTDLTDASNKKETKDASPQIIFGIDASASAAVKYTTYSGLEATAQVTTLKSGIPTRDLLLDFIRHLGLQVLEPTSAVFKSACPGIAVSASEGGVPGVEAYRSAKVGSLWFMHDGILWGESKPCEFWAVSDLIARETALRLISATGRTCTLVITRKSSTEELALLEGDEEEPAVETALTMIDGREQEGINKWVREHRHLFGKEPTATLDAAALLVQDDSDEDSDFEQNEESDGGSAFDESDDDDDSDSDDAETVSEDGEGEQDGEADSDDKDQELRPENHPLMQPGAMPRMSRAAIDMVAAMVTGDLLGSDEEAEGEDELDD
ncbi:Rtt106 domain-containing protein [Mycena indigotica]|uniref:Rtt106 domain-containing protein n=1 Tax=Mycena indigotica TaxID=2126181 RepID=A0A8H6ST06_9AGAR|nr:Rtt106 domain-containing protein [Mycena indigotica]KAF7303837.1 Rtt106 domain-containing protein [Mycena indigotica]